MSDFFIKIENFLFDILGLVLPGFIFLLLLLLPLVCLDFNSIDKQLTNSSYLLSSFLAVENLLLFKKSISDSQLVILIGIVSYLLGHVVKVFSIIMYDFLVVVFDKSFNKLIIWLWDILYSPFDWFCKKIFSKNLSETAVGKYVTTLLSPVKNTLRKIFEFKSDEYFKDNDSIRTSCIEAINQKLNTNYPDKWYSLYKLSSIINSQENIKSLASNFLAKYNLYRSLSFIFLFGTLYFYIFFIQTNNVISAEYVKISFEVSIFCLILWFTFHYKYKRYWTLCGNETLISLYCYLNKKKLNEDR